jgi:glutathione S-transferase
MIELFQFPWSPFCIVQRRILEYSGTRFKIVHVPNTKRALVWRATRQRYYSVPIVRDGGSVVFEVDANSQVIAKYLDSRLNLGLFPWELEGVQSILWRYIEDEIEGLGFRLNDVYWKEYLPPEEHMDFIRHKERKFGRGCLDDWKRRRPELLAQLEQKLIPFEEMLMFKPFLLGDTPRFVDFDLYGMLANFLYSGHYRLPLAHNHLREWYSVMTHIQFKNVAREKELHPGYKRPAPRSKLAPEVRR